MKSRRNRRFRDLLRLLPSDIRKQALAAYQLFLADPFHPSLQFKRVGKNNPVWSARVGLDYRVLGLRDSDDEIEWFWIGTHAEYDKLISRM
jgi:mRNA-degrading endonuclease RelE of RelBE toxin-antitoxin system